MTLRRDEGAFYIACLVLGGLSALWWLSNPAPIERFTILLLASVVVGAILIVTLMVWVDGGQG